MNGLKFGANYVPSKNWFFSWVDFEKNHIEEDFCALKEIGLDHLRVHLRWDLFQPAKFFVPESMLQKLIVMHDIAEKVGLKLIVSVFTGWMSGLWFLPAFTWRKHIFLDRELIEAEKYLLKNIARAVGGHKAFGGVDLGNELDVYGYFMQTFSTAEGDSWLKEMTDYCEELFPNKTVVFGVDHIPWFGDDYFSRNALANTGNMTSLHTWTSFTGANKYGVESAENLSLLEYNIELANAYAKDQNRKVWIQEFGAIKEWIPEDKFEIFLKQSMRNACRSENLWGFTIWCSHEYDSKLADVEEWETRLGILTKDNKLKPLGRYYKEIISELKNNPIERTLEYGSALVIDDAERFSGWKYGEAFANSIRQGTHLKFILPDDAKNEELLKRRNINNIIDLNVKE